MDEREGGGLLWCMFVGFFVFVCVCVWWWWGGGGEVQQPERKMERVVQGGDGYLIGMKRVLRYRTG